jgi:predicted enzyme related to lactoylglutathione lyase
MGQPVVHFEVMGKDVAKLSGFYSELFDWQIDTSNPMGYGLVDREANLNADGSASAAGSARRRRATPATSPSTSPSPTSAPRSSTRNGSAAPA